MLLPVFVEMLQNQPRPLGTGRPTSCPLVPGVWLSGLSIETLRRVQTCWWWSLVWLTLTLSKPQRTRLVSTSYSNHTAEESVVSWWSRQYLVLTSYKSCVLDVTVSHTHFDYLSVTVFHTSTCFISLQYPTHPLAIYLLQCSTYPHAIYLLQCSTYPHAIYHYSIPHIHMLFIITVSHTSTCYLSL